jgi:hypothetical protein
VTHVGKACPRGAGAQFSSHADSYGSFFGYQALRRSLALLTSGTILSGFSRDWCWGGGVGGCRETLSRVRTQNFGQMVSRVIHGQAIGDYRVAGGKLALLLGGTPKVGGCFCGWEACDSNVGYCLVECPEAGFVQFDVDPIS